jgi:hypothetical protein
VLLTSQFGQQLLAKRVWARHDAVGLGSGVAVISAGDSRQWAVTTKASRMRIGRRKHTAQALFPLRGVRALSGS